MPRSAPLPADHESAHALIRLLQQELSGRDLLIEKLKHQLAGQLRHRFGASSESLDQLQLMLEDLELERSAQTALAGPDPAEPKQKPVRKSLPDHLPRHDQVLGVTGDCRACGGMLKQVGEDVTEELEDIPGRLVANRIIRPPHSLHLL